MLNQGIFLNCVDTKPETDFSALSGWAAGVVNVSSDVDRESLL